MPEFELEGGNKSRNLLEISDHNAAALSVEMIYDYSCQPVDHFICQCIVIFAF